MASIARRPNGKYRARYRDDANKEHSKHFDKKIDAENWLSTTKSRMLKGEYIDPNAGKIRFSEYHKQWRSRLTVKSTTSDQIDAYFGKHVLPEFGPRQMRSITRSDIQAWIERRKQTGLSAGSIRVIFTYLASLFDSAVNDEYIAKSPCNKLRLPPRKRIKITSAIPTDTVLSIAEASPDRYQALIITAATTGLRQGELFGLQRKHVDFMRRTVLVEQQLITPNKGQPFISPPKTSASYRTVPLPDPAIDALAHHFAQFVPNDEPDMFIFTNENGDPMRRNTFNIMWRKAVKESKQMSVKFHDLRHYYVSLLIYAGESVKVVQARLGHSSAAMTLDIYAALWPDNDEATRAAINNEFAGRSESAKQRETLENDTTQQAT